MVMYPPDSPRRAGRPPGALNKRSERAIELLQRQKFCPITALVQVHREAIKNYARALKQVEDEDPAGKIEPASIWLRQALDSASDLIVYAHPKLKSIEQRQESPLDDLSAEEKLLHIEKMAEELRLEIASKVHKLSPPEEDE